MNAKELRLGNIVKIDNPKYHPNVTQPLRVVAVREVSYPDKIRHEIQLNSLNDNENITTPLYSQLSEFVKPIPITEEILKKCGFYQMAHRTVMNSWTCDLDRNRKLSIGFVETPNEMVYLYEVDENEEGLREVTDMVIIHNYDYNGMLFLHQLQNLYFSITNKELEVKL